MDISEKQLASKKRVGKLGSSPVFELVTKGGLHLIVGTKGGKFETLGAGPHRAVARHIAKKREPEIDWNDLQKSDYVDPAHFQFVLPDYEVLTEQIRTAEEQLRTTKP